MQYARLGETGLVVSRLAFGSMTFGHATAGPFTTVYKVDQAGANDLVARAIDGGVNFFNSADVYAGGDSERILGKALGARRREVVIATKVGNRTGPALIESGLSRRHVLAA
ncbi:MAG: aldo/keto reductase, partial [Steroidobacterales bacterium]